MFIPCAQEIFYYDGSVQTVSTNRMRAQDAEPLLVPGLETAATSWKQTTPTLSNSRCGRGPLPLPPGTVPTLRGPVPTLRDQSLHFANRKAAKSLKTSRKKKINRYTLPRAEGGRSVSLATRHSPLVTAFLTGTVQRVEIAITPCKQTRKHFLPGTQTPCRDFRTTTRQSHD
jgi:hypothetical protein